MRQAGKNGLALVDALGAMELTAADGATVELAKDLAQKIDSTADERLQVRYSAHYARLLDGLQRRSDANRARRLAAEEEQRKAEERKARQRNNMVAKLRAEYRSMQRGGAEPDPEETARLRTRIRRWARGGMTLRQIALRLGGVAEEYVHGFLTAELQRQLGPPAPSGAIDTGNLTEAERKLLERSQREEEAIANGGARCRDAG